MGLEHELRIFARKSSARKSSGVPRGQGAAASIFEALARERERDRDRDRERERARQRKGERETQNPKPGTRPSAPHSPGPAAKARTRPPPAQSCRERCGGLTIPTSPTDWSPNATGARSRYDTPVVVVATSGAARRRRTRTLTMACDGKKASKTGMGPRKRGRSGSSGEKFRPG